MGSLQPFHKAPEQTRRTTMAEAAEFIEQRKKEFMQAAEAGPDILSREETPKKDRNRRRRRSSVGETYGAKGKAGFCHRADGQSNMHVRNSNVKSKIVSVATHENPDKSKIRRSSTETSPRSPKSTTTRSRQNSAKCREQPPVVAFPNQQGTDFASRSEFTVVTLPQILELLPELPPELTRKRERNRALQIGGMYMGRCSQEVRAVWRITLI